MSEALKKIVLFFFLGLGFLDPLNGQVLNLQVGGVHSRLSWSVMDIPNQAPITGVDETVYEEPLIGPSFFLGVDYFEHKYFGLSTNLGYLQKGGKYTKDIFFSITEEKALLHYLSFNQCIDLKLPLNKTATAFIRIGPRIDYLGSTEGDIISNLSGPYSGELKNLMYGLIFGAGYRYNLNKLQLGLRLDYYQNFSDIANYTFSRKNAVLGYGEGSLKDFSFNLNLSLGYSLL